MWLQDAGLAQTNHLIMIFIGLVALFMLGMLIALVAIAVTAGKAVKSMTATVEELKGKVLPIIDVATDIGKTGREMLQEAAPKVKVITDNLLKTSEIARDAVQKVDATITDANQRTQRQVARVDDMVTAALKTTAEVAEAIGQGIRVPAQKIAEIAGQAKNIAEGLFAKIRSVAENSPFGRRKAPVEADPEPPPYS